MEALLSSEAQNFSSATAAASSVWHLIVSIRCIDDNNVSYESHEHLASWRQTAGLSP